MGNTTVDESEKKIKFEGVEIGRVEHFYNKISVVVLRTKESLSKGDKIRVYDKKGDVILEQEVESMQINGKDVDVAEKGSDIGLKVNGKVKEGDLVYKI